MVDRVGKKQSVESGETLPDVFEGLTVLHNELLRFYAEHKRKFQQANERVDEESYLNNEKASFVQALDVFRSKMSELIEALKVDVVKIFDADLAKMRVLYRRISEVDAPTVARLMAFDQELYGIDSAVHQSIYERRLQVIQSSCLGWFPEVERRFATLVGEVAAAAHDKSDVALQNARAFRGMVSIFDQHFASMNDFVGSAKAFWAETFIRRDALMEPLEKVLQFYDKSSKVDVWLRNCEREKKVVIQRLRSRSKDLDQANGLIEGLRSDLKLSRMMTLLTLIAALGTGFFAGFKVFGGRGNNSAQGVEYGRVRGGLADVVEPEGPMQRESIEQMEVAKGIEMVANETLLDWRGDLFVSDEDVAKRLAKGLDDNAVQDFIRFAKELCEKKGVSWLVAKELIQDLSSWQT